MNLTTWEDFERGFIVGQSGEDPRKWKPWDAERRRKMRQKMRQIEVRNALILMHQWMMEAGLTSLSCGGTELWIEVSPSGIWLHDLYGGDGKGGLVLTWTEDAWEWKVEGSWKEMEDVFGWVWGWLVSESGPPNR